MIKISTDVFCDFCNNWIKGPTSINVKVGKATAMAQEVGWNQVRVNGKVKHICPGCQLEREELQQ